MRWTYLVKCYPGKDKKPLKNHVESCFSHIETELKLNPSINLIITVGSLPLSAFGPIKLKENAGHPLELESDFFKGNLIPIMNPAGISKNPRMEVDIQMQLREVEAFLNQENIRTLPNNYTKIVDFITLSSPVYEGVSGLYAFDFETTGLKHWRDKLRCVSFSSVPKYAFCIENVNSIPISFWTGNKFIAHNAKFEWLFARTHLGIDLNIVGDTKMAHFLLHEELPNNLDQLSRIYTSMGGFKDETVEWLRQNNNDWANMPMDMLYRRNCADSDSTLRLHLLFKQELKEQGLTWFYDNIAVPIQRIASLFEERGMYVNRETLIKIKTLEKQKADILLAKICAAYDLKEINFRSPKQMNDLIFNKMGISRNLAGTTKTGGDSTNAESLDGIMAELEDKDKIDQLQAILDARSQLYNVSKCDEIWDSIRPDGTISTDLDYAVTFRFKSSKPNLQNIPTDGVIKEAFESRFQGGLIVEADQSQLELRLIGGESHCRALMQAYKDNRNVHTETAKRFSIDRNDAKRVNFAVAYGVGPAKLSRELKISFQDAQYFLREKSKEWWEIGIWRRRKVDFCREKGYVDNKFGLRRRLPNINSPEKGLRIDAELQSGNFPIQSLGVCTVDYAAIELERQMRQKGMKSILIMQIHDSLLVDYHPQDNLEELKELIQYCMVTHCMKLGFYQIPLAIEFKIGKTWGAKE